MPNNPEKLDELLVKVNRANDHILDLQIRIIQFRTKGDSCAVLHEDDLQTAERTYYLRIVEKIPLQFSASIGDIVQNLRSSLDHLAWHLVKSSPVAQKAKDADIYFPIYETAREYRADKMRKIQGMTDAAIQAIDAVEPYYRPDILPGIGRGVALFWIHVLNKLDKHRLLIPIWEDMTSHSMPRSQKAAMAEGLKAAFGDNWQNTLIALNRVTSGPLKDGSKLFTLPISEVDDNMKFRFQIAFGEPKWVCGKEIVSSLANMHRVVRKLMIDFDAKGLI